MCSASHRSCPKSQNPICSGAAFSMKTCTFLGWGAFGRVDPQILPFWACDASPSLAFPYFRMPKCFHRHFRGQREAANPWPCTPPPFLQRTQRCQFFSKLRICVRVSLGFFTDACAVCAVGGVALLLGFAWYAYPPPPPPPPGGGRLWPTHSPAHELGWGVSGAGRGCHALRPHGGTPAAHPQPSQSIVGACRGSAPFGPPKGPAAQFGPSGWWKKGKEPLAGPRTTVRPPCGINHPGHHAGAYATRGNHTEGGRPGDVVERSSARGRGGPRPSPGLPEVRRRPSRTPQRGAHHPPSARHPQPSRSAPCTRGGTWWTTRTPDGGWKCWAARTRKCGEVCGGRPECENRKTTPAPTSTTLVCQLLGSANAETTPAGTRAAAAVRTQSDLTQRPKGRTGESPRPREETATGRTTCPWKHRKAGGGRPDCEGEWAAKTKTRPSHQPAQPPVCQLLGSTNVTTTPAGTPAAAADKTQPPEAACEGKNG